MRSLLFVPGDRPDRLAKAFASGAHAVIVDLEDAVAPAAKSAARTALAEWLAAQPPPAPLAVRINAPGTPWFDADLGLAGAAGVTAVVVPKAEREQDLQRVRQAGARALWPLIETGAGFDALPALAAVGLGVERLLFGTIDLQADLGLRDAAEDELLPFRLQLVTASRRAGIAAPVDGVTATVADRTRLDVDVQRARRLGFGGKLCIHPAQVAGVNAAFAPTAAELDWARRVRAALDDAGDGVVVVDGRMVDAPVRKLAAAILGEGGR